MGYEVGDEFKFEAEPITFGQDFEWWHGTLPGVTLTLEKFTHDGLFAWLRGPGYGAKDAYGNGAIHVATAELDKRSSFTRLVKQRPEPTAPQYGYYY